MAIDIKQLQQALIAANEFEKAAIVVDPRTQIDVYPTLFLKRYQIYRLRPYNRYKPLLRYLGFAPNLPIYSLVGNPQAYIDLAKADQVDLATLDVAINYATVFLEVTRSMSKLFYPVNSVDQIRFRRSLTTEQMDAKETLQKKYHSAITYPTGELTEYGYVIYIYVVNQQDLEYHTLKIGRKGDIVSHITTLERNMPVVVGGF